MKQSVFSFSRFCAFAQMLFCCVRLSGPLAAQNVSISDNPNANPDASAMLDVQSTTKGVLVPRMDSMSRKNIISPAVGLLVFDMDTESFWFRDGSGWVELKAGVSNEWNLTGNASTDPATNFIGTTDDKSLVFKVNNTERMTLDNQGRLLLKGAENNTSIGDQVFFKNTTGIHNVAVGAQALYNNLNGGLNVAIGRRALFSNDSSYNTAVGYEAMRDNTVGKRNTAIGNRAMIRNISGDENTAVGQEALFYNTTGNNNTAYGSYALSINVTGSENVAIGHNALNSTTVSSCTAVGSNAGMKNTTGGPNSFFGSNAGRENTTGGGNSFFGANSGLNNQTGANNSLFGSQAGESSLGANNNCFFGYRSGLNNTTGSRNDFFGLAAGSGNTTGYENCFFGESAGDQNTTGFKNVCIGSGADVSTPDLANAVALGYDAQVNATGKIRLGSTGVNVIEGNAPFTQPSDGRFKSNLTEDIPGLDLIKVLRPVSYNFEYVKFSKFLGEKNADVEHLRQKEQQREMGFIAQEVETACQRAGVPTTHLLHAPSNDQDNYSMSYGQLTVPLVKAVQEQQALIEGQKTEITELKAQLAGMQLQMQTLLSEVKAMKASVEKKDEGK